MSEKQETRIVRAIMRRLSLDWDFYGYHVHGSTMQRRGEPDLDLTVLTSVGYLAGKIEVKTPTGEPSAVQLLRLREYHRRGVHIVGIVTSPDEAVALIEAYQEYYFEGGELGQHGLSHYLIKHGIEDTYEIYSDLHSRNS